MNRSVQKAFEILSYVVNNSQKQSLNQVARSLKMNKTTLFRFISTLEHIGMLSKRNDIYVPGIKLFEMGSKVPVKQLIVDKVHPVLCRLTADVNETVNMGELYNNRVLYLDKTESKRSLQIRTVIGGTNPLHATALGKSILSILPDELCETIIANLKFEKKTPATITDPELLKKHIADVRAKGSGTDYEELEEGLYCVAVPLMIRQLNFYGAISFSGPSARFTPQWMAELAVKLKETASEIKELFE